MSKLIIFASYCGGNHLANMIGANYNLDNCINFQQLNLEYHNDTKFSTHMNLLFLKEQDTFQDNCIYLGHLDEVWNSYNDIKDVIKDVLLVSLHDYNYKTIRSYELSYLEFCAYTEPFVKKLFPHWNIQSITLNDVLSSGDVLKFVLDGTKFEISNQYKNLHDMWLNKITSGLKQSNKEEL